MSPTWQANSLVSFRCPTHKYTSISHSIHNTVHKTSSLTPTITVQYTSSSKTCCYNRLSQFLDLNYGPLDHNANKARVAPTISSISMHGINWVSCFYIFSDSLAPPHQAGSLYFSRVFERRPSNARAKPSLESLATAPPARPCSYRFLKPFSLSL